MHDFCLGLIGRCLSLQPWINISDLYHRRLKQMLKEKDGINMSVSIASNNNLTPFERMKILYGKKTLHGVLYNIRFINPNSQTFFLSERDNLGKYTYKLNPYVFNKRYSVPEPNMFPMIAKMRRGKDLHDLCPQEHEKGFKRKFFGIKLNEINLIIGKIFGLNKRALLNELYHLKKLRDLCRNLNIPLFVLGPMPDLRSLRCKNNLRIFGKTAEKMKKTLLQYSIPNYFLTSVHDENRRFLYKNDMQHLSKEGHAFLAKELYSPISVWMKGIINNRSDFSEK